jgi:RNA polymerase sigma-70 factor (ECF subfamily)
MTALTVPSSDSTSASLIARIRRRDGDAWQRLANCYGPLVYGWARQAHLQSSDAADVMQEVFRAVARNMEGFHHTAPGDSFRGWLWTITKNKIRDHFRRLSQRREAHGGDEIEQIISQIPDQPPPEELSDSAQIDGASVRLVRATLQFVKGEFEPRTWQAFWRVTMEDESPAAAAAELGMSIGALYVAKSRVLKRLREELAGLVKEPSR